MTRLEVFESGQGLMLAKLGIVPISQLVKFDLYKSYQEFLQKGFSRSEAKNQVCDTRKCSYSNLIRAIYFFERDLQKTEKIIRV